MKYTDSPGLTCDADHVYRMAGETVLGVSEVEELNGFESDEFFTAEHSSRGHAVHAALAQYARGKSREDLTTFGDLHEDLWGWFHSGADFLDAERAAGAVVLGVEVMRFQPLYRFAGTLDLVLLRGGYEWVLDHKTGAAPKIACVKLAAYDLLLGPTADGKPRKKACLELDRGGGRARLVEYNRIEHFHDGARFLAHLTTARDHFIFGKLKEDHHVGQPNA